MEKEYVVTLHNRDDLEQFYNEMQLSGFTLAAKRPISRNTHYIMTEEQAEQLRKDPRVWGVEAVDSFKVARQSINNEPYTKSGNFWKDDTVAPATVSINDFQWGHLHCAGDQTQRRKGSWGSGAANETVNDTVSIFSSGRHVDVVIVDDPVSYDSREWYSPTTNETRFVQYQWFNELNTIVNSIDDDAQTEPSGTITYGTNADTSQYHGIHVTGTACGRHYGWAREANIYNMAVTDPWPSGQQVGALLIFDYLRAFHRNKPINLETGRRNPTISNHSYGGIVAINSGVTLTNLTEVYYRGTLYTASNPPAGGWTQANLENLFGVRFNYTTYPAWSSAVAADVQDAIEDGVVIIGAAGNENLLMAEVNDSDWNNYITVSGVGSFYYNRGAWPNTPDSGAINVGALSKYSDFRRSTYTNFGPAIDVFAPGDNILSAYGNTGGLNDSKYPAGNYFYPIDGTSMASPQVCGVAAILAGLKERFTNADLLGFLNKKSIQGDMTFDLAGGSYSDSSCRKGSPNKYLHIENPRILSGYISEVSGNRTSGMTFPRPKIYYTPGPPRTFSINVFNNGSSGYLLTGSDRNDIFTNSQNKSLNIRRGDILVFNVSASGHPLWIKTQFQTSTGFTVDVNTTTNNGSDSGTITWDTTTITAGTYYYICQFHITMGASITIS